MLNFVYFISSRLHFFCIFGLIHALSTRGEAWACFGLLHAFRWFPSGFEQFLSSCCSQMVIGLTGVVHRSDWCEAQVPGDLAHQFDQCSWLVKARLKQLLCFARWFTCIRPEGVALVQGELACVQGELLVVSRALDWWLVLLAWACFVSDVSSRCPFLRGPRLVFFKWPCSLPFLWLSITCWSLF
jgi:hypothetical protein